MRSAARGARAAVTAMTVWFAFAAVAFAQNGQAPSQNSQVPATRAEDRLWYEDGCPSLQQATLPTTVSYLSTVVPDKENAICVTYAIQKIEDSLYEPAVPALVKLLDFRRPDLPYEHSILMTHIPPDWFPARSVLRRIGTAALPALLQAILADSTPPVTRTFALQDWMMIYEGDRNSEQGPYRSAKAIARLAREGMKGSPSAIEERLRGILLEALGSCVAMNADVSQIAACRQAMNTGTVPESPRPKQ